MNGKSYVILIALAVLVGTILWFLTLGTDDAKTRHQSPMSLQVLIGDDCAYRDESMRKTSSRATSPSSILASTSSGASASANTIRSHAKRLKSAPRLRRRRTRHIPLSPVRRSRRSRNSRLSIRRWSKAASTRGLWRFCGGQRAGRPTGGGESADGDAATLVERAASPFGGEGTRWQRVLLKGASVVQRHAPEARRPPRFAGI